MSNGHNAGDESDDPLFSIEQIARLDAFLDQLNDDHRPISRQLTRQDTVERLIAAQLRLLWEGVEEPTPRFLTALERALTRAVTREQRDQRRMSLTRWGLLRTVGAATLAGLAGAGVAAETLRHQPDAPQAPVSNAGSWYDVGTVGELADGQIKGFAAGGILGYLINEGGRLHAVSAICTHMGCRLKPDQGSVGLHCLCHGSRFGADGRVLRGPAVTRLPTIDVRVIAGRVYARGTIENV